MSRYIDTKWLEENAKEYSLGYYDNDEYAVPLSVLEEAPSIDIVFCKECRYYHQLYGCQKNDDIDLVTSDDDFCSYGERRE